MTPTLVFTAARAIDEADVLSALAGAALSPMRRLGARALEADLAEGDDADQDAADARVRTLRAALAARAVDVNRAPGPPRRKKLLIADMDSTMIPVECVDELAEAAGVREAVVAITERAMRGELAFEDSLRERVALLKGLPLSALEQVYAERVSLSPGAETLVRRMGAAGATTALVSGGFTFFTERVARAAGFQRHHANRLLHDGERLTGAVAEPILGRDAKRTIMDAILAEQGLAPEDAVAVGDGANDLAIIRHAGLGVAYRAKPALAEAADARLDHSDLTALLALQGFGADERLC